MGGCGYFGFGTAATAGISSAKIAKFICDWLTGSHTVGTNVPAKAQRQCMTKNAAGLFTSTAATLAITYAPTSNCNALAGFSMTPSSGAVVSGPITNNLYSISSITDLTDPTAPVDVDA